jgi:hypothetical protein
MIDLPSVVLSMISNDGDVDANEQVVAFPEVDVAVRDTSGLGDKVFKLLLGQGRTITGNTLQGAQLALKVGRTARYRCAEAKD